MLSCFRYTALTLLLFFWGVTSAQAIPNLQIYFPDSDAYYDGVSESWTTINPEFRVDVVGANAVIADVKIALAVPTGQNGSITVRKLGDPTEYLLTEALVPSVPLDFAMEDASFGDSFFVNKNVAYFPEKNGYPRMGDGQTLPGGGIFPSSYYQFYLGDFGLNTTVHNYIPGEDFLSTADGHIEQLIIRVSGYTSVHIVAYDHIVLGQNTGKYVKTPYSHDGTYMVPEPGTFMLLGFGLVGLIAFRMRRRGAN